MDKAEKYIIPLTDSIEEYLCDFNITDLLFKDNDAEEISVDSLHLNVVVNKLNSFTDLKLSIKGTINLVCDRCLEYFKHELEIQESLLLKPGISGSDIIEDNVLIYPAESKEYDISKFVYDTIILYLPFKKVHANPALCDQDMLRKLESCQYNNIKDQIDQRWNELKKISYGTS